MTIEEAVRTINNCYRRVILPGPCEGYEVRQMEKALKLLTEELKKAVERKF